MTVMMIGHPQAAGQKRDSDADSVPIASLTQESRWGAPSEIAEEAAGGATAAAQQRTDRHGRCQARRTHTILLYHGNIDRPACSVLAGRTRSVASVALPQWGIACRD